MNALIRIIASWFRKKITDPRQVLWQKLEQTVSFARYAEEDEIKIKYINKAIDQLMALKRKYQN